MLTKADLSAIRKIIREEIETEMKNTKADLEGEIKLSRIEIQNELGSVNKRLKNIEIVSNTVQKDLKKVVNFFDKGYLELKKRMEQIEKRLGLSALQ